MVALRALEYATQLILQPLIGTLHAELPFVIILLLNPLIEAIF